MTAVAHSRSLFIRLARLAWAGVIARYRLVGGFGWIRLAGAVLDPYLYAAAIFFVLSTVFRLDGMQRFWLLLIGVVAFRWTLASLMSAGHFGGLRARLAEHSNRPFLAAMVATLAPPTVVFAMSLGTVILLLVVLDPPVQSFAALAWLPLVLAVQGVWTAVAIAVLDALRQLGWLTSNAVLILLVSLLWILSPVMYTFEDVPATGSLILTSYNPASHLLAGYHNALWFGHGVSMNVLPLAGLLGVGLLVVLARRGSDNAGADEEPLHIEGAGSRPCLVSLASGPPRARFPDSDGQAVFGRWRERFTDWTGEDLVRVLLAVGDGDDLQHRLQKVERESRIDRLFREYLVVYPDWALAHLAFAVAIQSPRERIVLDGILDDATGEFAAAAWERLSALAAAGRPVTLVTYRAFIPPAGAEGTYVVAGADGMAAMGEIGPDLPARLQAVHGRLPEGGRRAAP